MKYIVDTNILIDHLRGDSKATAFLAVTSHTVRIAAKFHRNYRTDLADALIGATAFLAKAALVTRNFKHFQNIRELHVQNLPFN